MRLLLAILLTVLMAPCNLFGAIFPLEITNIKPAGSGTPALPSTHRIFRAYPGIEYNIRVAAIGGVYPYSYSLNNEPSGMTINSATGEISWPNPQSSASNIQVSVTDQDAATESATWSIAVSTSGFIFVNSSYSGTETGSLSQPYSTMSNMLNNESTTTDIVYFRAGTYGMVDFNSTADYVQNMSNSPQTLLGYPEETVTIQGSSSTSSDAHRIVSTTASFYVDGLNFTNVVNYGFLLGNRHNHTFRRCSFSGLTVDSSVNENYGFLYFSNELSPGYFAVIQDCTFTDWAGGSAIGSIYYISKMLIENNHIYDSSGGGLTGIENGISPKYGTDYLTVRGNRVDMDAGFPMGGNNAAFNGADDVEVCYNYFSSPSGEYGPCLHYEDGTQGDSYWWRNTFECNWTVRFQAGGSHSLYDNVIINENSDFGGKTATNFITHGSSYTLASLSLTQTDNLKGLRTAGIIDANGDLTASYSSYVGNTGWQFADGSTPMDGAYTPATCSDYNGDQSSCESNGCNYCAGTCQSGACSQSASLSWGQDGTVSFNQAGTVSFNQ